MLRVSEIWDKQRMYCTGFLERAYKKRKLLSREIYRTYT